MKFQVDKMVPGKDGNPLWVELFGHSECQCWSVMITNQGAIGFGKYCEKASFYEADYHITQSTPTKLAINYDEA